MKQNISMSMRILLGVFLIGYALNQFLHFLPTSYGMISEHARDFIDAVVYYLPFLYLFEMLIGVLLIINIWSAFIYIVLFPLSLGFLLFTLTSNDASQMWPALLVAVLNIILLVVRRDKYLPLLKK